MPDPQLTPVDHDPFGFTPVDHDPFAADGAANGLDPSQYKVTAPPTVADKAGELWKVLLPQSLQDPTHEDWQAYHKRENEARARGEGYYGPTPDQNARMAAAFFGPIELGSMLPTSVLGAGAKTALGMTNPGFWARNPAALTKLKDLVAEGKTSTEIASELGVTRNAVAGVIDRLGISTGNSTGSARAGMVYGRPIDELRQARESGKSFYEIARDWDVNRAALMSAAKRYGLTDVLADPGSRARIEPSLPRLKSLNQPAEASSDAELAEYERIFGAKDTDILRAHVAASGYNPPARELRPFEADYAQGALTDGSGRLTHDIEGRPLTARFVAGRRVVGGRDQAIRPEEHDALATVLTGNPAVGIARGRMAGASGRVYENLATSRPEEMGLAKDLKPDERARVYGHELGHAIDILAGKPDTAGMLKGELQPNYNILNNPNRDYKNPAEPAAWGKPVTAEAFDYKGAQVPREYWAEAVRAYMTDPNYFKTVAPKAATRIRELVNSNPRLKDIIQFNALPIAAAGGAAGLQFTPVDHDPFR
jgi:hypothetical protein